MTYDKIGVRYPWKGGHCPVDVQAMVKVKLRGQNRYSPPSKAGIFDWSWEEIAGDIIAFEIAEFAK